MTEGEHEHRQAWRRDAHRWAVKYGAVATVFMFFYMWRRVRPPDMTGAELLLMQVGWALGFGVLCAVIVFCVRFSGALVDLDELDATGRGGLGLNRAQRRKEGSDSQH